MKRILLTAVALGVLGMVSPALGADLAAYTKAPAVAAPAYDWTGFYVGVFGGGGFGNHNVNNALGASSTFTNFTANYSSQGGLAGGEAGYNRPGSPLTPNGQLPYTTESTYSVATVGLDYKFGRPVVAKY